MEKGWVLSPCADRLLEPHDVTSLLDIDKVSCSVSNSIINRLLLISLLAVIELDRSYSGGFFGKSRII